MRFTLIYSLGLFFCTVLTISGCSLRQAEQNQAALPTELHDNIEQTWWTMYNEPELNKLVERALEQNIDLQQSRLMTEKAFYQLKISQQELWPKAGATLGGKKNKNLENGRENTSFSSDLSLNYELDLWKKLAASTQANQHSYQASQQDLQAARISLASTVIDAWFHLASLDQSILLMQKNLDCHKQLFAISRARYLAGKTSKSPFRASRQALLSAKMRLVELQKNQRDVIVMLNNILNLKPKEAQNLKPAPVINAAQHTVNLDIPLSVLGQRPDLRAAESRLQAAWSQKEAQQRNWYPKISLRAGIGTQTDEPGKLFDIPIGMGSISVALPFLQWNTLKWQNKIAEANFQSARLDFEKKLTTALNEVASASHHYRLAQKNLAWNEEKHALELENSRYHQLRHEQGSGEFEDWLRALTVLYTTEQAIAQAKYQVLKYENLIYKSMAGRYSTGKKKADSSADKTPDCCCDQQPHP